MGLLCAGYPPVQQAYPTADPGVVAAYQDEAVLLAQQALALVQQKTAVGETLQRLHPEGTRQHPDAVLFESFARSGALPRPDLIGEVW